MRRIDSMGFKTPAAWKDELYRNELMKLDIKREMTRRDELGQTGGENEFKSDIEKMNSTYFDKVYQQNYQKHNRANTAQKSVRRGPRIQPETINCSGAKNLRLLRDQGKLRLLTTPSIPAIHSRSILQGKLKHPAQSQRPKDLTQGGSVSTKMSEYMKNQADMQQIEKIIITQEDHDAMAKRKQEDETNGHFCSRCLNNQTLSQLNRQIITQDRRKKKLMRDGGINTDRAALSSTRVNQSGAKSATNLGGTHRPAGAYQFGATTHGVGFGVGVASMESTSTSRLGATRPCTHHETRPDPYGELATRFYGQKAVE